MDPFLNELKRKAFHHLSLVYMLMYAFLPRAVVLTILFVALAVVGLVEFLRLRRPELNAKLLERFGGMHRLHEITEPSGIFWTLLGCWLTMFIFTNKRIVLPALGFLTFGDSVAALAGKRWGHLYGHWAKYPDKTYVGSAACAIVCIVWAFFFLNWAVAIVGGFLAAWIESRKWPWNDNLWIPFASGVALSLLNLTIGRL